MRTAIELSKRGLGLTAPNPTVGAILVHEDIVVGRGVTASGGRPHAERIALDQAGEHAKGATLFVTLEPCAHRSQAGVSSCTDAVIAAGISKVVIGASDPSPFAAGQGAARLRSHGIEVVTGVEEEKAEYVNRGHILRVVENRPMVLLKLARTADGFAGTVDHKPLNITGKATRTKVHLMRAQADAIAVGISTVLADDPMLDVRLEGLENRSPIRIVFDRHLRLPLSSKLVQTARNVPVWIIAGPEVSAMRKQALNEAGVDIFHISTFNAQSLKDALAHLAERGITRLMLEGGPNLAEAFMAAGFIDELALFTAPWSAGKGISALGPSLKSFIKTQDAHITNIGDDQLQIYRKK